MGNLSSSPFPKKQSITTKTKIVKPEVGGDGDAVVPNDITDEQAAEFIEKIEKLKKEILAAQGTAAAATTGGKSNPRKLRIKFA